MRLRVRRSGLLALVIAGLAGCGEPEAAAPEPHESAPSTTAPSTTASESTAPRVRAPSAEGLVPSQVLADGLPDRLGPFHADGDAHHSVDRSGAVVTTSAERRYRDGDRVATLRAIDASRAPDLVIGFAAAQQIHLGPMDAQEIVATGIADRPGLASWDPDTQTSEAQVLAGNRMVLALSIAPCRVPEEAVEVLDEAPIAALESLLR